jgi:murein DD-endopeptidase MepM/ murein hydrolase activator NlpD
MRPMEPLVYLLHASLLVFMMGVPATVAPSPQEGLVESTTPMLQSLDAHHTAKQTTLRQLIWPVIGAHRIASGYGVRRDPLTGHKSIHRGVDIAAAVGTGIRAIGAGRVLFSGWRPGYGRTVEIDHGRGWLSRYAHAQALLVVTGATVWAGQLIAKVGKSGRATGPHLHFEVWQHGHPIDPLRFWGAEGVQRLR